LNNEYLLKEYEFNFEQLRFYDNRHDSILKFLFSLTSAVATALFAIYKLLGGPTCDFYAFAAVIAFIVFLTTLIFIPAMLQNRLYFVLTARQLNAIRAYMMKNAAGDFKDNRLYLDKDFPTFKTRSVHTFQLLGAVLISAVFGGLSCFAIFRMYSVNYGIKISIAISLIIMFIEIITGAKYLISKGTKTADEGVHGTHSTNTK
jgi:hypothetical protein